MPYAINIRSDDSTSDPIRSLWEQCAFLEESPSMAALNYPPHLTLAVYDEIDPDALSDALDASVGDLEATSVRFEQLGCFQTPETIVLYAAPSLPPAVTKFHERIHSLIGAERCRMNYRPGVWVPHCSLAIAIDRSRREAAIGLAASKIEPFEVLFDVADCARFVPVEVLHQRTLLAPGSV
jgi:2'-5' RNA ligase